MCFCVCARDRLVGALLNDVLVTGGTKSDLCLQKYTACTSSPALSIVWYVLVWAVKSIYTVWLLVHADKYKHLDAFQQQAKFLYLGAINVASIAAVIVPTVFFAADFVALAFGLKCSAIVYVCISSPSLWVIPRLLNREECPDFSSNREYVVVA